MPAHVPFSFGLMIASLMFSCHAELLDRQNCGPKFDICSPRGATTKSLGVPGTSWTDLFSSIMDTVTSDPAADNSSDSRDGSDGPAKREAALCCAENAQCLLLQNYHIPMCWDPFTTDVYFPDGSYGSVVRGNFTTHNGDSVNLIYGNYTLNDGTTGNIYVNRSETTTIHTATGSMPTSWMSSSLSSTIPATELGTIGSLSTITSTVPGTTISPVVLPSITIIATMTGCGHCNAANTTISGGTVPGSTRPASTSVFTTGIIIPPIMNGTPGNVLTMTKVLLLISYTFGVALLSQT